MRMGCEMIEKMVEQVGWFSKVDYPLWNFLDKHRIIVTPSVIARNIGYDNNYIGKRCRVMVEAGLMNRLGEGVYEISELGEQFLDGELSRQELQALDPEAE